MPRIPTGDQNANLAVQLFRDIMTATGWGRDRAWLAIAKLLMTCDVWGNGAWRSFHDFPVLVESNKYKFIKTGAPNARMADANRVGDYLASELGISRALLCSEIAIYFKSPQVLNLQPNNIKGHGFRSLVAETLAMFGDPTLAISEEEFPHRMFPGYPFPNRSPKARIDIVARRGTMPVALLSTRWTYRHDRADMIDEAAAYIPAARGINPNCLYYGVTAEFDVARLKKVIHVTAPVLQTAALRRLVHINPVLVTTVTGKNGELANLMSLEELCQESFSWR